MIIDVRVKPRSKRQSVTPVGDQELVVSVTAAPTDNQANNAVIKAVAGYFDIAPSRLRIARGRKSRNKTLEIMVERKRSPSQ